MSIYRLKSTATLAFTLTVILASTTAHAEIKGDAIRIGVLTDMNGVFATAMGPGSVEAARMAAEEFGDKIKGRPIEILQADHQNKPDVATSLAKMVRSRRRPGDRRRRQFGRRACGPRTRARRWKDFSDIRRRCQPIDR
jgi:hypothetical protein